MRCESHLADKRLRMLNLYANFPFSSFVHSAFSGLDSSSSAHCVQLLHNLSREGRTIVFTVHQPSAAIYEMFDQVYVLAQGQCVYRGSSDDTLSYLSENGLQCPMYHSLADFREFLRSHSTSARLHNWKKLLSLHSACSDRSGERRLW